MRQVILFTALYKSDRVKTFSPQEKLSSAAIQNVPIDAFGELPSW